MAKKQSPVLIFHKKQKAHKKRAKRVIKDVIALRKVKKKALKARGKRSIKTEKVISPRHEADLIDPTKPFQYQRGDLESTAIAYFDYDPATLTLKIQYWKVTVREGKIINKRRGGKYLYFQVPNKIYEGLVKASSKGRYVNQYIKTKYDFKPI